MNKIMMSVGKAPLPLEAGMNWESPIYQKFG